MLSTTEPDYWEQRYQENTAKWDIGMAAPPFTSLLASIDAPIAGKTAVLGCGQGHDALLFAKHDFDTIGFDFAPSAIALGQKLSTTMGISMQFLQRDIFGLPNEFPASFDYVLMLRGRNSEFLEKRETSPNCIEVKFRLESKVIEFSFDTKAL